MSMKSLSGFAVITIWFASCASSAQAANDQAISQITAVLRSDSRLVPQRQDRLIAVAQTRLNHADEISNDKLGHLREHLAVCLDDLLRDNQQLDDKQFQVVVDGFDWKLSNYVMMPSINDATRKRSQQLIEQLPDGVRAFIKKSYTDTPPDIQDKLASEAVKCMAGLKVRAGNYFYPELLYPVENEISIDSIVARLANKPFMQNNGTKFASVADILSDNNIPKASRIVHVGFFVNREGAMLQSALVMMAPEFFDLTQQGASKVYKMPPPELMKEYMNVGTELNARAQKKIEEESRQASHEVVVNRLTDGTGISVAHGVVQLPEKFPNSSEHSAEASLSNDVLAGPSNPPPDVPVPIVVAATSSAPVEFWNVKHALIVTVFVLIIGTVSAFIWRRSRA